MLINKKYLIQKFDVLFLECHFFLSVRIGFLYHLIGHQTLSLENDMIPQNK